MIVERRHIEGFVLLKVEGVIKLGESADFFAETLARTLESHQGDVIVDLAGVNTIDSTGLGELIGYLGRFRARARRLILVQPQERILKLLSVVGLLDQFQIFDDLDAAVLSS